MGNTDAPALKAFICPECQAVNHSDVIPAACALCGTANPDAPKAATASTAEDERAARMAADPARGDCNGTAAGTEGGQLSVGPVSEEGTDSGAGARSHEVGQVTDTLLEM